MKRRSLIIAIVIVLIVVNATFLIIKFPFPCDYEHGAWDYLRKSCTCIGIKKSTFPEGAVDVGVSYGCIGIPINRKECIAEGGSTAPELDTKGNISPRCCEGLTPITHIKEEDGEWFTLAGSSFCTKCGDGICGNPENIKNCPEDCV